MREVLAAFRKKQRELLTFQTDENFFHRERRQQMLSDQKNFVSNLTKSAANKSTTLCHIIHPPSVIPLFPRSEKGASDARLIDSKQFKLIQSSIENYKLTIKSKPDVRIQDNFVKFNSGGPILEDNNSEAFTTIPVTLHSPLTLTHPLSQVLTKK